MALGCAAASQAHAQSWFQFESGIGGSAYSDGGDGYWYQEGFEHKLRLTAPSFEVGITGDLYQREHWGISYHVDWAWLGTIHTQSLAVTDGDYDPSAHRCTTNCGNTANFVGSGHESGFIFALEPYYNVGAWRFGIEAGPFLHRSTWTVDVSGSGNWFGGTNGAARVVSSDGWRLGAVVGAEVSYKRLSIVYQHFFVHPSGANAFPPIWHSVDVLLAKYKF